MNYKRNGLTGLLDKMINGDVGWMKEVSDANIIPTLLLESETSIRLLSFSFSVKK